MNLTFAAQLNKMITAGLGGAVEAPETCVAVGRRVEYTSIGPAPILTFEANSELPLKALSVNMEPIQEGSGDPSPENVSPISGRQSVTVTRSGRNLFPLTINIDDSNRSHNYAQRNYPELGGFFANLNRLKGRTVTLSCDTTGTMSDATPIGRMVVFSGQTTLAAINPGQTTIPTTVDFSTATDLSIYGSRTGATIKNYQIEVGSSASAFEAYHADTIEVQLSQTVYGGTVDVVSGEMVVDRAMVDLGTLAWAFRDSGTAVAPYFFAPINDLGVKYEGNFQLVTYNILCSMYKTVNRDTSTFVDGTVCVDGIQTTQSVSQFQIKDYRYSDAASFKTAMNGVQLCYELAQPITITLTPEQLTTVLGTNNVWSDADEVSLTYGNIYYTEGY